LELSQKMRGHVKVLEVPHASHHLYIDNSTYFNNTILSVAEDVNHDEIQSWVGASSAEVPTATEVALGE